MVVIGSCDRSEKVPGVMSPVTLIIRVEEVA
jgi:hypothetical protein